jgi:hypothetical protein
MKFLNLLRNQILSLSVSNLFYLNLNHPNKQTQIKHFDMNKRVLSNKYLIDLQSYFISLKNKYKSIKINE